MHQMFSVVHFVTWERNGANVNAIFRRFILTVSLLEFANYSLGSNRLDVGNQGVFCTEAMNEHSRKKSTEIVEREREKTSEKTDVPLAGRALLSSQWDKKTRQQRTNQRRNWYSEMIHREFVNSFVLYAGTLWDAQDYGHE